MTCKEIAAKVFALLGVVSLSLTPTLAILGEVASCAACFAAVSVLGGIAAYLDPKL